MGKSMKKYTLPFLIISLISLGVACKKEKSPELEITVLDQNNAAVKGIVVRTSIPGSDQGIVNPQVLDSIRTDEFGKVFLEYDNTILLRVDAFFVADEILDSLDILLETKRLKKGDDNYYERTMRVVNN